MCSEELASTSSAACSDAESNDTDNKASTITSAHNEEAWTDVNLNEDSQSNNEDEGKIHRGEIKQNICRNYLLVIIGKLIKLNKEKNNMC